MNISNFTKLANAVLNEGATVCIGIDTVGGVPCLHVGVFGKKTEKKAESGDPSTKREAESSSCASSASAGSKCAAPDESARQVAFKRILDGVGISHLAELADAFQALENGVAPTVEQIELAKGILGADDPVVKYAESLRAAADKAEADAESEDDGEDNPGYTPHELTFSEVSSAFKALVAAFGKEYESEIREAVTEAADCPEFVSADRLDLAERILGKDHPFVRYVRAAQSGEE